MDAEEARRRFQTGACILCLNVPPGIEMRMDLHQFHAGPEFKGVKMIPPGVHIMTWAAGHETAGAVFIYSPAEVQVWRWDALEEDLIQVMDKVETERLTHGVRNYVFDSHLGAYPTDQSEEWSRLTYLISTQVLHTCQIESGQRLSGASSLGDDQVSAGIKESTESSTRSAPVFPAAQSQRKRVGMDPTQVSKYNLDGSERILEILKTSFDGSWVCLLGQVQLSFVLFLVLSSLEGLEHWKSMVALLCTCGTLMRSMPEFMSEFVRVLRRQLERLPEDFFRDELLSESFLRPALEALFLEAEGCADQEPSNRFILLERRIARLRKVLSERFDVDMARAAQNSTSVAALLDPQERCENAPTLVLPDDLELPLQTDFATKSLLESTFGCSSTCTSADVRGPAPQRMSWMMPPESDKQ